jgi:hypothetical protein
MLVTIHQFENIKIWPQHKFGKEIGEGGVQTIEQKYILHIIVRIGGPTTLHLFIINISLLIKLAN